MKKCLPKPVVPRGFLFDRHIHFLKNVSLMSLILDVSYTVRVSSYVLYC